MIIKFIQVNIFRGTYLDSLVDFLKVQKPDVVSMQEVTSGFANFYPDKGLNLFEYIKRSVGMEGVFYQNINILDKPDSFEGNAVLTRFPILESNLVQFKNLTSITFESFSDSKLASEYCRSIVEIKVNLAGKEIYLMSCHGAWTEEAVDTAEKTRQAKLIAGHLKSLGKPFILGTDLNMPPGTKVADIVSKSAKNWMRGSKIKRTTHPVVHKTVGWMPDGLLVDYLFSSGEFKLVTIEAPDVLVSDHLPLVATFEFGD